MELTDSKALADDWERGKENAHPEDLERLLDGIDVWIADVKDVLSRKGSGRIRRLRGRTTFQKRVRLARPRVNEIQPGPDVAQYLPSPVPRDANSLFVSSAPEDDEHFEPLFPDQESDASAPEDNHSMVTPPSGDSETHESFLGIGPTETDYFGEGIANLDDISVDHLADIYASWNHGASAQPPEQNRDAGLAPENADEASEIIDVASRLGFRLPDAASETDDILRGDQVRELLRPLLDGSRPSPALIYSLLYCLLPAPLDIFQQSDWIDGTFLDQCEESGIAVAIYDTPEPVLILIDVRNQTEFRIGPPDSAAKVAPLLPGVWERKIKDVSSTQY